jgi:hypothetical protein
MKKRIKFGFIILLSCMFLSFLASAQTVTVFGTIQTAGPTGGNAGGNLDYVIFRLRGWQGNLPRVNGIGPISVLNYTITPSASGQFTTTLYGNDQITPYGTYYVFEQWHDGKIQSSATYQFCTNTSCPQGLASRCPCTVNFQPPLPLNQIYKGNY